MPSLVPVYDDKWNVVLYDIFIDGTWIGSRRTRGQAESAAAHHLGIDVGIFSEGVGISRQKYTNTHETV